MVHTALVPTQSPRTEVPPMSVEFDLIQSLALAIVLLIFGEWMRDRVEVLQRFSVPAPVVGGFLFALIALVFRQTGTAELTFDTSLQAPAMIAFFTTVGLGGSLAMIRKGGRLLVVYLLACWALAIAQNLIGMGVASALGIEPMLGIMAGAASLEGGHGGAAAFGATAEEMGFSGATTVAISAATFGLVAGSLVGGPLAVFLMGRHRVAVPDPASVHAGSTRSDAGPAEPSRGRRSAQDSGGVTSRYRNFLVVSMIVAVVMVLGTYVSAWLTSVTGFTLPAYVGAMLVAVLLRNVNDALGWIEIDDDTVALVSHLTLGFFLTMAMMTLRIWELADLALPLVVLLVVQLVFIVVFAVFVLFPALGRDYDAATMVSGFLGHGLGATPNALANMDAFNTKYGLRAERAFLVVPLAGAVLIDIVALPWIAWCMNLVA